MTKRKDKNTAKSNENPSNVRGGGGGRGGGNAGT